MEGGFHEAAINPVVFDARFKRQALAVAPICADYHAFVACYRAS